MYLTDFDLYDDTSPYLGQWETILEDYQHQVTVEELWEFSRGFDAMPHFGNLYQELVINRLMSLFYEEVGLDCNSALLTFNYDVNAIATYININGVCIGDRDDWYAVLDEVKHTLKQAESVHGL